MPTFVKASALIFFFFLLSSFLAPPKKTVVALRHGSVLIYDVDANTEKYTLTVTIKRTKPDIMFSYETSGASNKKGTVTIPEKDMDSARTLSNDFSGGKKTLSGEVSLFLSRSIYAEIAMAGMNDGGTSFKPNPNEAMDAFTKGEPNTNEVKVNGHKMQLDGERFYDYVDEKHGNYHYAFTVLKDENYPLILDMSLGWILHLKEMDDVDLVKE